MIIWLIKKCFHIYYNFCTDVIRIAIALLFPSFFIKIKDQSTYLAKKIVILIFALCNCYFFAALFTFIFYFLYLPLIDKHVDLTFIKTEEGYSASLVNYQQGLGICSESFNTTLIPQSASFLKNRDSLCQASPGASEYNINRPLNLDAEIYTSSLVLYIPNMELNYRAGSFAVNVFLFDKYGEVYPFHKFTSVYHHSKSNFLARIASFILKFLGLIETSKDLEIEIPILDNLPNQVSYMTKQNEPHEFALRKVMNIQGVFVSIPERNLLFSDGRLIFKAYTLGLRHLLYNWFWTCYLISVNVVAISFFILFLSLKLIKGGCKRALRIFGFSKKKDKLS